MKFRNKKHKLLALQEKEFSIEDVADKGLFTIDYKGDEAVTFDLTQSEPPEVEKKGPTPAQKRRASALLKAREPLPKQGKPQLYDLWAPSSPRKKVKSTERVPATQPLTTIKPVEIPHPGTSYRPDEESHKNLREMVNNEKEKIQREKTREKNLSREIVKLQEQYRNIKPEAEPISLYMDDYEDQDTSEAEGRSSSPPLSATKIKKYRCKHYERLAKAEQRRKRRRRTRCLGQRSFYMEALFYHRLELAQNKLVELAKGREAKQKRREEWLKLKRLNIKTHRTGPIKYKEDFKDFGYVPRRPKSQGLRFVKPMQSVLGERWRSLMRRNLVEHDKPQRPTRTIELGNGRLVKKNVPAKEVARKLARERLPPLSVYGDTWETGS